MTTPTFRLICGDALATMRGMEAHSVEAIVTDPPYMIDFMGKAFDTSKGNIAASVELWAEALRVARPGAHLLAFGGTRTHHRLMVAIEDAGWEIRDTLMWVTGQGFPKNLNVGKAIRKQFSADALCACDQHSTRTTQDSQDDCPEYHHSDDGQLHADQDNDLDVSRQPTDVHAHSRIGLHGDVPAFAQASISPGATNGHLSNCNAFPPLGHLSISCQADDSSPSDTALNMSNAFETENHKTDSRKQYKHDSASDSASSSLPSPDNVTYMNLPHCTTCGKPIATAFDGFGSALKPSFEPIILARAPLSEPTIAANCLKHGTGAINVDACRIPTSDDLSGGTYGGVFSGTRDENGNLCKAIGSGDKGRWPANLLLSDQAAALLDQMSGVSSSKRAERGKGIDGATFRHVNGATNGVRGHDDRGGSSRFFARFAHDAADDEPLRMFYAAKASKRDRDEGLEGMPEHEARHAYGDGLNSATKIRTDEQAQNGVNRDMRRNHHPTVKPIPLMRWLAKLICVPGGTILDPFCGSGSTGKAAMLEGFNFIGIDNDPEYVEIARRRIEHARAQYAAAHAQPTLFEVVT